MKLGGWNKQDSGSLNQGACRIICRLKMGPDESKDYQSTKTGSYIHTLQVITLMPLYCNCLMVFFKLC